MDIAPWLDQARALQTETFVFDYAPCGEPIIMTPRHRAQMMAGLEHKLPIGRILATMTRDRLDEIATSTELRARIRACWDQSGVDAVQLTLGGRALAPQLWDACIEDVGHWLHRARAGGDMAVCTSADDLVQARAAGRIGLVFGLQDSGVIGTDLDRLDLLYRMGLRVAQLTYNTRNAIGDGCEERAPAGLSRFGLVAVHRMNALGIVVDVSHCGPATTMDAISMSRAPVAVTHACCHTVAAHPRAKTDDVLRALRDTGGFFGIVTVPKFLSPEGQADLGVMLRHIDHAVSILGTDKVGIATDWGGWTPDLPPELIDAATENFRRLGFKADTSPQFGVGLPEFTAWEQWPHLTASLLAAGYPADDVRQMIGGNWLAFTRRVEAASRIA
ncbi:dipeptidase [Tistrella mobilis]|uniref:Glutamine amidotransferase, class II/dipeptidase n=1 Tax=Tistrella mobilis (strain KA081020-065) TaxID=1110502 RepID=I3TLK2_TISMK|nr:membrane dipeptidase [Tistrella mobilis]AFK53640.1 glutamine amidotransferase, class II/dipeptidase [Tistrella mobilis KA081020-065]